MFLLSTLPDPEVSAVVEVVLAYRCGAVPALHRVPFSANDETVLGVSTSMDMCVGDGSVSATCTV